MKYNITKQDALWLKETYDKMALKLQHECQRMGNKIPYIPENGVYPDYGSIDLPFWTNGFWGGIMWQMFSATGQEQYKNSALALEKRLDGALEEFIGLHHDVGFMWLHTAVANVRLCGDERARQRAIHAATVLAGRFNPAGEFISAWNENRPGWMIIDSMMNVPLLYWASQELEDPRFDEVARRHVDTLIKLLVRSDGSVHHIAVADTKTGELIEHPAGQGYASGSSWSRGQSWAIYGFAISYRHKKDTRYLNIAKAVANSFLANTEQTGYVPLVDFKAPEQPVQYDTTAAVCAACGMLEISEHTEGAERQLYIDGALKLIKAVTEKYADFDVKTDGILGGGTVAYHREDQTHVPIIYGDYFLLEALLRLQDKGFFIW